MSYCPDCKQEIRLGGPPHTCPERREREAPDQIPAPKEPHKSDCNPSLVRPIHGWRSECDPLTKNHQLTYKTFSMSFFLIVPRANGKGTKGKSIGYRLSGPCTHRDEVAKRADEIVEKLNDGWVPPKKSERFLF